MKIISRVIIYVGGHSNWARGTPTGAARGTAAAETRYGGTPTPVPEPAAAAETLGGIKHFYDFPAPTPFRRDPTAISV
jgi:hypothetical protein